MNAVCPFYEKSLAREGQFFRFFRSTERNSEAARKEGEGKPERVVVFRSFTRLSFHSIICKGCIGGGHELNEFALTKTRIRVTLNLITACSERHSFLLVTEITLAARRLYSSSMGDGRTRAAAFGTKVADADEAVEVADASCGFHLHFRRALGAHQLEVVLGLRLYNYKLPSFCFTKP
jgi:hypothetical protein